MGKDHQLVITDIETTGLEPDDFVLEIAAITVDDELNIRGTFHSLVTEAASLDVIERKLHPKARVMHEQNGLLTDLRREYERTNRQSAPMHVERRFLEFLMCTEAEPGRILWTGYSVHFDKRMLARALPLVDWAASYQLFEIGSARRIFNLGGFNLKKRQVSGRPHRAQDDAMSSLEELRVLRDYARIAYRFSVPPANTNV